MACEIRLAVEADFGEVQKLDERATHRHSDRSSKILNFIRFQNCKVILVNNQVSGYLTWSPLFFRGSDFINLLVVVPDFRRQGLATALLQDFQNTAEGKECWTSTNASNVTMRSLLSKCGWVDSGYEEHLDPGDPDLFYVFHKEGN